MAAMQTPEPPNVTAAQAEQAEFKALVNNAQYTAAQALEPPADIPTTNIDFGILWQHVFGRGNWEGTIRAPRNAPCAKIAHLAAS